VKGRRQSPHRITPPAAVSAELHRRVYLRQVVETHAIVMGGKMIVSREYWEQLKQLKRVAAEEQIPLPASTVIDGMDLVLASDWVLPTRQYVGRRERRRARWKKLRITKDRFVYVDRDAGKSVEFSRPRFPIANELAEAE
jgi:hypothetical protein